MPRLEITNRNDYRNAYCEEYEAFEAHPQHRGSVISPAVQVF